MLGATEQYPAPCCGAPNLYMTFASQINRERHSKEQSTAPLHPSTSCNEYPMIDASGQTTNQNIARFLPAMARSAPDRTAVLCAHAPDLLGRSRLSFAELDA